MVPMTPSDEGLPAKPADSTAPSPRLRAGLPHEFDHTHSDVSGGWLRAASFGAMDGLVSNTALIAGVAAGADAHTVVLSGTAGLLAGAFSMALGEYTSVTTANEQIDSEVRTERRAFRTHPQAEKDELVDMLVGMGMNEKTARTATEEIHQDENQAVHFHMVQELGVDPREKPSARLAAISSFIMFAIGAVIPLVPYLLGYKSLGAGLVCGGVGLIIAGGLAARFTGKPVWWASGRQLLFGAIAIGATYLAGSLIGSFA
jgi:vacuolar iron transporter family protein